MDKGYIEVSQSRPQKHSPLDPCIVVIFGASGDLTHRELIPALYALSCKNLLPKPFAVVGFARRQWDDEGFRQEMYEAVKRERECGEEDWRGFVKRLYYVSGDFNDDSSGPYALLREKIRKIQSELNIPDHLLFHLATPPHFYSAIIHRLDPASLARSEKGWRRVVIEKPFGEDQKTARDLDEDIHAVFQEQQVFRVDHFLGKETVQNMLVFRFANPGFEPIWNRKYIDNVQITVSEEIGIGTRGNFYEKTGVLRDMVQNHLLQLLCMTALEPPGNYDASSLRTETIKVLESICSIDIESECVLGQYNAGIIRGQQVRAYREEENVAKDSRVPTFAALRLMLDNWRWSDVPFYLRSGKRMNRKLTEVTIEFKATPHLMFPVDKKERMHRNVLTFRLQPDEGIIHTFLAKQPGAELRLCPVNLRFLYNTAFGIDEPPSAYQWLLFDALRNDQTLFPRADWIYKAWSIIDPIVEKWESEPWLDVPSYSSGSWGPALADELIRKDGRNWNISESSN